MRSNQTFWELLGKVTIEIPRIQRDYAQGRNDRKTRQIREDFVKTLCTFVEDTNKHLDLDFVYGSSSSGKLVLLDGQQRLTTLFLLHWYVAMRSGNLTTEIKGRLTRFTYETRTSSRDFCEALVSYDLSKDQRLTDTALSSVIEDSPWFAMSWKKDPTVASMLVMLDEINSVFEVKNGTELWEKLTDNVNPAVTFYFLDMDTFKLTDELYIKMNSRGKPLSDFENFKAWLEKYVEVNGYTLNGGWEEKMDKVWTDLFWQHRDNGSYEIDKSVLAFFKGMAMSRFAQSRLMAGSKLESKLDDEWLKAFNAEEFIATSDYEKLECFDVIGLNRSFSILDFFVAYLGQTERRDKQFDELFGIFTVPKYVERVISYALSVFVSKLPAFELWDDRLFENLRQWIRVMKNMIQNSRIDDPDAFVSAIQSIDKVSNSILDRVVNGELTVYEAIAGMQKQDISYFREVQVFEEIRKAGLIVKDPGWEELLHTYEQHKYFYGQVGFLLDFSEEDITNFEKYAAKAAKLYTPEMLESKEHKLERALLSIGNYLIEVGQYNHGFCLPKYGTSRLRDENWRSVFDNKERSQYLKELLDRIDVEAIDISLDKIIDEALESDRLEEWRHLIIACPETIEACEARQVRFENNSQNIYILSKTRMSGYYAELWTYQFFATYLNSDEANIKPFGEARYHWVNGRENDPCILLEGWKYKGVDVALDITYDGENYTIDIYEKEEQSLPESLLVLLGEYEFYYDEEQWPSRKVDKSSLVTVLESLLKTFLEIVDKRKDEQ